MFGAGGAASCRHTQQVLASGHGASPFSLFLLGDSQPVQEGWICRVCRALLSSAVGLLQSLRRWIGMIATEEWQLLPVQNPQHCSAVGGVCFVLCWL